jgi:hypothetical protein
VTSPAASRRGPNETTEPYEIGLVGADSQRVKLTTTQAVSGEDELVIVTTDEHGDRLAGIEETVRQRLRQNGVESVDPSEGRITVASYDKVG